MMPSLAFGQFQSKSNLTIEFHDEMVTRLYHIPRNNSKH